MNAPGRKTQHHDVPSWVDPAESDYFITICCQQRGTDQLCTAAIGPAILSAARVYHEQHKWFVSLLLLMPDHLHMLVSFGREYDMAKMVREWKRYLAAQHGIEWQREFFEHRLRSHESTDQKVRYIMQNPVRAGLVEQAAAWPWVLTLD